MSYIQTFSGKQIDFFNPQPDQVDINDIAHALAYTPRFSGHTKRFYPVAAHSLMVAEISAPGHKLQGLLHDATEAYCTDMPTPFKRNMEQYQELEYRVWMAISEKFNLAPVLHSSVKLADRLCLMKEADELQPNRCGWGDEYEQHARAQKIWTGDVNKVKDEFLRAYKAYGGN